MDTPRFAAERRAMRPRSSGDKVAPNATLRFRCAIRRRFGDARCAIIPQTQPTSSDNPNGKSRTSARAALSPVRINASSNEIFFIMDLKIALQHPKAQGRQFRGAVFLERGLEAIKVLLGRPHVLHVQLTAARGEFGELGRRERMMIVITRGEQDLGAEVLEHLLERMRDR